jgi:hypothetical protein
MELFSKGHYPESEVRTNAFATYSLRVGGMELVCAKVVGHTMAHQDWESRDAGTKLT